MKKLTPRLIKKIINSQLLWLLLCFPLLENRSAEASTFIGNGGNAGDLDLAITLSRIKEVFHDLDPEELSIICRCQESSQTFPLCKVTDRLNKSEEKTCAKTMLKHRSQLVQLSGPHAKITFRWLDKAPKVKSAPGARNRRVQAVSQFKKRVILIHEDAFLDMDESHRISLITHELFHFVKTKDGQQIFKDEGGEVASNLMQWGPQPQSTLMKTAIYACTRSTAPKPTKTLG